MKNVASDDSGTAAGRMQLPGEINKNYYQLPVVQSGTQSTASRVGNRLLWVEQVAVPDYLGGDMSVVYQTSDVKYVIANNNLWASPLDQQLRNTLVANLSTQLPGWVVASPASAGSAQEHAQCYRNGV